MAKCVSFDSTNIICMSLHDEEAPFVGAKMNSDNYDYDISEAGDSEEYSVE